MTQQLSKIPATVQRLDQWICWRTEQREGKATKAPIEPGTWRYASTTDDDTWTDFDTA